MLIWTEAYRPFIMGGDVNAPVGTEIDESQLTKFDIGKGFFAYVIVSPRTGKTHIVEASTGAFIGQDLESIKADVEACPDIAMMQEQVAEADARSKKVAYLTAAEFWNMVK